MQHDRFLALNDDSLRTTNDRNSAQGTKFSFLVQVHGLRFGMWAALLVVVKSARPISFQISLMCGATDTMLMPSPPLPLSASTYEPDAEFSQSEVNE